MADVLPAGLECKRVDELTRVIWITPDTHSELTGKLAYGGVVRELHGIQLLYAVSLGVRDQLLQEEPVQALVLPRICNRDRQLSSTIAWVFGVTTDADFSFVSILIHGGDKRHGMLAIDIAQTFQLLRRELFYTAEEAIVLGLRRQVSDELVLHSVDADPPAHSGLVMLGSPYAPAWMDRELRTSPLRANALPT
jgi:hypothetical protein